VSIYYYLRVVVFMWINEEAPVGSPLAIGPAMSVALGVALLGTVVFGLYPEFLFEQAQAAARTLEGISTSATLLSE
jgi:NADH:ubiquinone oxidoreductase subunit 2 (subunit N)